MTAIVVLAAAAAATQRWGVPLDVLLVWRNPTPLSLATEPSGASLRLDGVTLPGTSPTTVTVRRDLLDHAVEATLPGYRPARAIVRYDKAVALSFVMSLQALPSPPPAVPGAREAAPPLPQ